MPIVIPPIYGLKGVGFETFTADGPIWSWNSYVGVGQMGGHGSFTDLRLPLSIEQEHDTRHAQTAGAARLPIEPAGAEGADPHSVNQAAASRGKQLFRNEARCSTCHQGSTLTDVLSGADRTMPFLHAPAETGMDPVYASRSATKLYRTTPLRGLGCTTPPTSTTAARPTCPRSSITTTGSSTCI